MRIDCSADYGVIHPVNALTAEACPTCSGHGYEWNLKKSKRPVSCSECHGTGNSSVLAIYAEIVKENKLIFEKASADADANA